MQTHETIVILLALFESGVVMASTDSLETCDKSGQSCTESTLTAILLGGTGATGKEVLKELNSRVEISKIIFITRRPVEFPDMPKVRNKYLSFMFIQ